MRVLIVDDDEIDLKLLHVTLARAGYDVDVRAEWPTGVEDGAGWRIAW